MNDTDLQAIRAEFAEFVGADLRQPGDIDIKQLAKALNIGETTARRRIKDIAAERKDYQLVKIKDGGIEMWVLRRIG